MKLKDNKKTKIKGSLWISIVTWVGDALSDYIGYPGLIFYTDKEGMSRGDTTKIIKSVSYQIAKYGGKKEREKDIKRLKKKFNCCFVNHEIK